MTRLRRSKAWLMLLAAGSLLAYLRDPPWLAHATSGFFRWEQNRLGVHYRWMGGRASFFVPADAERVDIPFKALFPRGAASEPFEIDIRVDEKSVTRAVLGKEEWVIVTVPIRRLRTSRRLRRVDMFANRTWTERSLSVQVGEVVVTH